MTRELANLNPMVEDQVGFDTAIREKYIAGQLWQSVRYRGILVPPWRRELIKRYFALGPRIGRNVSG